MFLLQDCGVQRNKARKNSQGLKSGHQKDLPTCVGNVLGGGAVGLLDSKAATEWSCESVIAAPDGADVSGGG